MDPTPGRALQSLAAMKNAESPDKLHELQAFVFLTVVMAPVLAGLIVATYGFAVWVYQMFAGPPGS